MGSLYTKANKDQVGEFVIFSGDPFRVNVLKKYLERAQEVAFAREFNTVTGYYKGVKVTVTSTGIGSPSAAIAMEEMYECGMKVAIRMGTAMALEDKMLGHFMVPIASMRREGTSDTYIERGYPAVADIEIVNTMNDTIKGFNKKSYNGISCTMDGFYTNMHDSKFSVEKKRNMQKVYDELKGYGISGIDMESSCMLTIARLMGVKMAVVTMVTVLENLKEQLLGEERIEAEDLLCRVVLEGIYNYSKKFN